ncbi:MAG: hypothetical protein ACREBB_01635 [Nitrosotalea sp.]
MKFERKPIESNPTCAMCGKAINSHTPEKMKECANERKNANTNTGSKPEYSKS